MTYEQPDHVDELYTLLCGEPVFLEIPKGKKGPTAKKWNQTTYDDTQAPLYQEAIRRDCNLGVLLGSASKCRSLGEDFHLCSIDVDEESGFLELEALNKCLRDTLVTKGARGRQYWLWVLKDSYPPLAKLKARDEDGNPDPASPFGEWRATGGQTVIYGTHPTGVSYSIVRRRRPVFIHFDELNWPESIYLPWEEDVDPIAKLIDEFGEPIAYSKGGVSLNPPFFVEKFRRERAILYEPEEGRFFQYEDATGLWRKKTDAKVRADFSQELGTMAKQLECPALQRKRTNGTLQGLVDLLKGYSEKESAFGRPDLGIVHVANGMLNLAAEDMTISDFSPKYYSRNQIPFPFDESATCPRFIDELLISAIPPSDIKILQRWAGQVLLGINIGQVILILTGTAGAGKSTFAGIISTIIGQENTVALRTHLLAQRFEAYNYRGKNLLVGSDVNPRFLSTQGANELKSLVGGDIIMAEKKNGDSVSLIGDFNVIITSNSRLKVRLEGDNDAWQRRLILVPYELPRPAKPDPQFKEKLIQSEASGILNWMIEGARDLLDDYAKTGKFQLEPLQKARVEGLLAESDSIREFVRGALAPAERADVTKEELYEGYISYCETRAWSPLPNAEVRTKLSDAILEIHRKTDRNDIDREGRAKRGYKGLRLLPHQ